MLQRLSPLLCLFAAACTQGSADAPAGIAPVDTAPPDNLTGPVDPVPSGPVDPALRPRMDRGGPSLLDSATQSERGDSQVDELDYAGLAPDVIARVAASPIVRYRMHAVPGFPDLYEFILLNTGSGWQEKFLLQVPPNAPTGPVPLVVVFHKYGTSHGDLLSSGFIPEVQSRGWYAMCPLGARQKNFGNLESQINISAALEIVRSLFPIDPARVYGVGFSMGGGSVANYAARHLDPSGVMFAAVCNHTGGVSLAHTWGYEPDDDDLDDDTPAPGQNLEVPDVLESLFGGTPLQQPFAYQRCSTIDLDPFSGVIGVDNDFARNLAHVPTLVWVAANEPMRYLHFQTTTFLLHVQGQNPANTLHVAPGNVHAWTTLDPAFVCNWLAQHTLTLPRNGRTMADEDGQWLDFFVEQDVTGSFTPFTWSIDTVAKRFTLSATRNLKRLRIDAPSMGLPITGPITLDLSTADGTGDIAELLYVPAAPVSVTRDGIPASGTYDPQAQTFAIAETDPALHTWLLTFP